MRKVDIYLRWLVQPGLEAMAFCQFCYVDNNITVGACSVDNNKVTALERLEVHTCTVDALLKEKKPPALQQNRQWLQCGFII